MSEEYRTMKSYWFVCWRPRRSQNLFDDVIELDGNDFLVQTAKKKITKDPKEFLMPVLLGSADAECYILSQTVIVNFKRVTRAAFDEFRLTHQ